MSAKSKQMVLFVILALAVVGGVAFLIFHRERSGDEIVIGVLVPKTGFMSGHGNSIEMGAELAADELNAAGGILGKKVRLVVLDTKSDPAEAAERAKELIDREKAVLLIGTGTSAESLAVVPSATQAKRPFIYTLDGECKTCAPGAPNTVNKYVYGSGFTERMIVKPFLEHLATKFAKPGKKLRVYFVGGDYVYPRTTNAYAREVAEKLGLEIAGEEYSDTATSDYAPVIDRIRKAKPDLLIVTNPGASGVTFMRQATLQGLDKEMTISGFATFDQEAIDTMGKASEGVYAVNRYSMHLDNEANKKFVAAFRKRYPDKPLLPGPTAAGAYGSIVLAAKAFQKAGSTDADKFRDAMKGLEMDLPQGKVQVNEKSNIFDQHIYILRIGDQQYRVETDLGMQVQPNFEGCSVK